MSRSCEITGKNVMSGNNVSHSNRKTRRRFLPNLHNSTFTSESLGIDMQMRVCTNAIRSVEKNGGLDNFLLKTKDSDLADKAISVKRKIKKKIAEKK